MENIKKYFNVLRNNENLSYGGLKTLKLIENEIDEFSKCNHENIVCVTETPQNGKRFGTHRTFIECEKCKKVLPIKRITNEDRTIDIWI